MTPEDDAIYDLLGSRVATDIDNDSLTEIIGDAGGKVIFTSNYARNGNHPNAMAISASVPKWFDKPQLKSLAPTWDMINAFKAGELTEEEYSSLYVELLETRELDPKEVFESLPNGAILLCYEKPNEFCHRRVLAKWLEEANKQPILEWVSEQEAEKERIVDDLLQF
jgi:uncharacterized protein YeaO (DUF488 family)